MISEFFPNPNPRKPKSAAISHWPGSAGAEEERKAKKRNISVEEYRRRVAVVQRAFKECPFYAGDVVWPKDPKEAEALGECRIVRIASHYDSMDGEDWNEAPLILHMKPMKESTEIFFCNVPFVQKTSPLKETS